MLKYLPYNLRMYLTFQMVHIRTALSYEADFWIGIVGVALTHGVGIVFVWSLFLRVPAIAGWTIWEVAMLYALSILPRGLTELLCDGQWRLRTLLNRGEFDRLLVRPMSPALQLITQFSSIHGFGSIILGTLVLLRAYTALGLHWNIGDGLILLLSLLSGTVLTSAINYASNCQGFWDPASNSSFPFLIQNLAEFAKFPLTLYDRLVQIVLTWIIPFACVSYFPGLILLKRPEAQSWMLAVAPLAAGAMLAVAALLWHVGLQRYQGTGS